MLLAVVVRGGGSHGLACVVQAGIDETGARRRPRVDRLQPERGRPGERGRDDGLGGGRVRGRGAGDGGGRVESRAPEVAGQGVAGVGEGRPGETGRRGRTGDIGRMDEPAGRLRERESDLRGDVVCRAGDIQSAGERH